MVSDPRTVGMSAATNGHLVPNHLKCCFSFFQEITRTMNQEPIRVGLPSLSQFLIDLISLMRGFMSYGVVCING